MSNVSVISSPDYPHSHCLDEIALAFSHAMDQGPEPLRQRPLVFGAHLLKEDTLSKDTIIYQSEQITKACWWNRDEYIDLLSAHEVWDYSQGNIAALKVMGVKAKLVPIAYMPSMKYFENHKDQEIDVLFYGSNNARRTKILQSLKDAGLNIAVLFNCYGSARDYFIQRAKVVLNIHYFEDGIFEIFRCAHLFAHSKCVVSERGRDGDLDERHKDSAVFCSANEIVETCKWLVENPRHRESQGRRALEAFKQTTLVDVLRKI